MYQLAKGVRRLRRQRPPAWWVHKLEARARALQLVHKQGAPASGQLHGAAGSEGSSELGASDAARTGSGVSAAQAKALQACLAAWRQGARGLVNATTRVSVVRV